MKFKSALLGVSAILLASSAQAGVNILVNGGFENSGFGGTSSYYNVGTDPGTNSGGPDHPVPSDFGWTVSNGNVDIVANGVYGTYLADGGNYNLDLVGYGTTGEISQTLNTVAGETYDVSFQYSENAGISGPTAAVLVNGGAIGNVTGTSSWQTFTGSFLGTGAPTTFAINETYGANNGGVFFWTMSP